MGIKKSKNAKLLLKKNFWKCFSYFSSKLNFVSRIRKVFPKRNIYLLFDFASIFQNKLYAKSKQSKLTGYDACKYMFKEIKEYILPYDKNREGNIFNSGTEEEEKYIIINDDDDENENDIEIINMRPKKVIIALDGDVKLRPSLKESRSSKNAQYVELKDIIIDDSEMIDPNVWRDNRGRNEVRLKVFYYVTEQIIKMWVKQFPSIDLIIESAVLKNKLNGEYYYGAIEIIKGITKEINNLNTTEGEQIMFGHINKICKTDPDGLFITDSMDTDLYTYSFLTQLNYPKRRIFLVYKHYNTIIDGTPYYENKKILSFDVSKCCSKIIKNGFNMFKNLDDDYNNKDIIPEYEYNNKSSFIIIDDDYNDDDYNDEKEYDDHDQKMNNENEKEIQSNEKYDKKRIAETEGIFMKEPCQDLSIYSEKEFDDVIFFALILGIFSGCDFVNSLTKIKWGFSYKKIFKKIFEREDNNNNNNNNNVKKNKKNDQSFKSSHKYFKYKSLNKERKYELVDNEWKDLLDNPMGTRYSIFIEHLCKMEWVLNYMSNPCDPKYFKSDDIKKTHRYLKYVSNSNNSLGHYLDKKNHKKRKKNKK